MTCMLIWLHKVIRTSIDWYTLPTQLFGSVKGKRFLHTCLK
ncbi:hypothetical protein C5167_024413 [Papaver somniferum]|uniref:Uncharacterized protein n=1 Tax=Papaver somniferum TaxID=3469 RepID=A0A4Y7JSD7_PAPSO|nr:hypothetical protein C5167_024413 [Papaver somniferum]